MDRCARCHTLTTTSPFEHFCADCGERLNELMAVVHDERRVLSFSEMAAWMANGELPEQMERRWRIA